MTAFVRAAVSLCKNSIYSSSVRAISTTKQLNIREIREKVENGTIVVEAVNVPSPRTELLVRAELDSLPTIDATVPGVVKSDKPPCYLCSLGLDVKHTDVLILSQFVRSDGCMLPQRITGLCKRQQKKIGKMVAMAQKAGLMINLTPANCKKDPTKRWSYKQFNTYFDEKTIFMKKQPKWADKFQFRARAK